MVAEDALKAVEALAGLVIELSHRVSVPPPGIDDLRGQLETLISGCEAIRAGKRGTPEAQRILDRPISTT